jgi:hypothetical protein
VISIAIYSTQRASAHFPAHTHEAPGSSALANIPTSQSD